jgi:putrescine aminotransferase
LLIGLQFANAALASEFSVGLLERDILVASALTNPHVIRMEPALTISYEDLARLLQAVEDTLQSLIVGAVALSRKG